MGDPKSIAVFTATHVKFDPPANPIYVPLHVGREGKEDLGYIGDNSGVHISDLNWLYGELTGLFWVWQNISGIDYAGLCHYRRYFLKDNHIMERGEYLDLLDTYDAIVPMHLDCGQRYHDYFGTAHDVKDLDAVGAAIEKLYPEYLDAYRKAMDGSIFYSGNLMVTSLELLKGYAKWLFSIFAEASEAIDVSSYDAYHKRVYGFLSEQMFYVYLMHHEYTYCEVPVGIAREKAETKELIGRLRQLMDQRLYKEAKQAFDQELLRRPDLLLPGSDIHGELQRIYEELKTR